MTSTAKPLYIYRSSNVFLPIDKQSEKPEPLKELLLRTTGKKIRRIDRLTQLALIGSYGCKGNMPLAENTGLYLSSIHGSINNTVKILQEIYQEGELPRPISFINSVSNSASFYLAQQLNILGVSQFILREYFPLEACIKLAAIDLALGNIDAALLGVVGEAGENISTHKQRLGVKPNDAIAEGSHWLYLAHEIKQQAPIAEIIAIEEPITQKALIEKINGLKNSTSKIAFSRNVQLAEQKNISQQCNVSPVPRNQTQATHELHNALLVGEFLADDCQHQQLHIDAHYPENGVVQYSLTAISKC